MSVALLFPGQGSQQVKMLGALPDSPAVTAVVDESHSWLADHGVTTDLDEPTALRDTTNVQLALLIAGVACARALTDDHGLVPQFVAGHSVGAFAAAVTARVLTLTEALAAVQIRGELMKEACATGDWGMAALTGLPTQSAARLVVGAHTDNKPVWVANINSATQTVVSGSLRALTNMSHPAKAAGATDYALLDVAVASHCPLQAGTARELARHLAGLPLRPPTVRYLTNTRGRAVNTAEVILDDLAQAVAHPIQWYDATRLMPELGVTSAIETQPGHVLTRLNTSNAPAVSSFSLQDTGTDAVIARA
jgi:malonate decarboxylase epsilon subunit